VNDAIRATETTQSSVIELPRISSRARPMYYSREMASALDVVTANLAAYNARDLDAFAASFDPAVEIYDLLASTVAMRGIAEVRARYAALFAASPALCSRILRRSVLGDLVCDHELVTGRFGGDLEILITYEVRAGTIRRIWIARTSVTGPHVVRAVAADLDALLTLGRATYCEHFAMIWSADGLERFLGGEFDPAAVVAELASPAVAYLLAFAPDAAGYAKLRLRRVVPGTEGAAEVGGELQKIYVRAAAAGHGLGAKLLDAAITAARDAGEPLVWLDVLKTNPNAARFYERHGFRIAGELPFATDLGEHGMWVMTRRIQGAG
jgi:ribosomal protein S18 acetylase RimI-like enzyme